MGIVTGLAWTSVGGEILQIETSISKCKGGKLTLTGNLGDVMKESVSIALGHIKSHAKEYKINLEELENTCIHINAIEGAIPKDGPSAGTALTTAIISSLLNKPVDQAIAMTGEMTLTGKVLPIGGLKEKSISAHRSGIKTVIYPRENEKDLDELPQTILQEIKFISVSSVDEVIEIALNESHVS